MDIVVITYTDDKEYEYLVIIWPGINVPTMASARVLINECIQSLTEG